MCIACSSNAATCSSSTIALTCNSGYYLSSNTCNTCIDGANVCSSPTVVTSCKTGY